MELRMKLNGNSPIGKQYRKHATLGWSAAAKLLQIVVKMSEAELFEAIQSFDQQQGKQLFQSFMDRGDCLVDSDNGTLLHVAANYNNHELLTHFLQQYDKMAIKQPKEYTEERKRQWLNRKDNEGFTCLHYVVFRGNAPLTFLLEEHGSDIYAINKQGLTVMHIAAQGNSPVLLYYFLNKGMRISTEDSKGSTPLHWACYSGQENSAYALLAWGAEIDKQDFTYGMTPLHLAVMSGNGRIVKKLLVRGCDRNIKNYNGKLPLDLARENEYKNITEMIIDKGGIQQLFNIKTPYRKIGPVTFPFYFMLLLFVSNYILNVSFVLFQHFPQNGDLAFAYLVIGLVVAVLFAVVARTPPGFIMIEERQNDFEMLKRNHASKICFDCMLVKPQRSRHCEICKHCVSVYDHHCPWVTNCVGSKNYFYFYLFLLLMWCFMTLTIIFEIINIVAVDWSDHSALEIIRIVCIFYGLVCSCLFFVPLTYLLIVQTRNCLTNQTTFERYGFQTKKESVTSLASNKSSSFRSDTLNEELLMKANANNSFDKLEASRSSKKSAKISAQSEANGATNCYKMCFGNAQNIVYQVGGFS